MKNDLISRSALEQEGFTHFIRVMAGGKVVRSKRIAEAPAVDAVEVVRCKNCKHYEVGVCLKIYSDGDVSPYAWQERKPDDFCSRGKRRADECI